MKKSTRPWARFLTQSASGVLDTSSLMPWAASSLVALLAAGAQWLVILLNPPWHTGRPEKHSHPHILNASTSLICICFIIIGGLKFSRLDIKTYADEIAWIAATLFFGNATISYFVIRNGATNNWQLLIADWIFIGGLLALISSVSIAIMEL